jgi:hypothetical protein
MFVACSWASSFRSSLLAVFSCRGFGGQSAWGPRTVRVGCVARRRSEVPAQTVRYCWCSTGSLWVFFGQSAATSRTVRRGHADSPPGARGQSAWCFAELLSSLLPVFHFRFVIIWGLFLGLVGPLSLRDLGKLVWRFLVVNFGHRPSSLFGEEFLSAPIHSPPLWSPNRSFNCCLDLVYIFIPCIYIYICILIYHDLGR